MTSKAMQEIHRARRDLEQRIHNLTLGAPITHDPHATPESMMQAVAHASNRHDVRLLHLYEKHLSIEYTPHTIKKVLAALTGREDYFPQHTLDADYGKVTPEHLEAFRKVMVRLGAGHPAWEPLAQEAARHPHAADQIIEQAVQGTVDPQEALRAARQHEDKNPHAQSISSLIDSNNLVPGSRPAPL